MNSVDVVENFVGVYLLRSLSPKYKGWTYIGYTVDPNRRLKQHNRGKKYGGAWRTSKRGPWEMVLTVYGFPNTTSALKFEWAWQHPKKSRRLKLKIKNKQRSESVLNYKIRVLFTALSTPPWNRLPLTVRWISADAIIDAPPNLMPPNHMPVTYGSVISKKVKYPGKSGKVEENTKSGGEYNVIVKCQICLRYVTEKDLLKCVNVNCQGCWHIICIAKKFLADEDRYSVPSTSKLVKRKMNRIIPIEGCCPQCKFFVLWGDLIRKKKGYHMKIESFSDSSVMVE